MYSPCWRGFLREEQDSTLSWKWSLNTVASFWTSCLFFLLTFYCVLLIISSNGIGGSTVKLFKKVKKTKWNCMIYSTYLSWRHNHVYDRGKSSKDIKQSSLVLTGCNIHLTLHPIILQTIQQKMIQSPRKSSLNVTIRIHKDW